MSHTRKNRGWELPESLVTDESKVVNRRSFIKASTTACAAASLGLLGCQTSRPHERSELSTPFPTPAPGEDPLAFGIEYPNAAYPVARPNSAFAPMPGREMVSHVNAASFNNFYEFTPVKGSVWKRVGAFETRPWTVDIGGLVHKPMRLDLDDLLGFDHEERIYRMRCVEAWSMVVPWAGFPLKALLDRVQPMANAKFVRFISAANPAQMPRVKSSTHYPWPYHEAIRIDEAANDLTMLVTGMFGKSLPRQNGAPIRLILPWKYGYKSIKSIARIEFVEKRPPTFWNSLEPAEYSFLSNVEPTIPHPRWSQAVERDIQTDEQHETQRFNGYGEYVASMYRS